MAQCKKLLTILGLPEYLLRNELYLHNNGMTVGISKIESTLRDPSCSQPFNLGAKAFIRGDSWSWIANVANGLCVYCIYEAST